MLFQQANDAYRRGDYSAAVRHYTDALSDSVGGTPHDRTFALLHRARAHTHLGDSASAVQDALVLLAQDRTDGSAWVVYLDGLEGGAGSVRDVARLATEALAVATLTPPQERRIKGILAAAVAMGGADAVAWDAQLGAPLRLHVMPIHDGGVFHVTVTNEFGLCDKHALRALKGRGAVLGVVGSSSSLLRCVSHTRLEEDGRGDYIVSPSSDDVITFTMMDVLSVTAIPQPAPYSSCRTLDVGNGVMITIAEASGDLGIAGRVWDGALCFLKYLTARDVVKGKCVWELGSGTGAVAVACCALGAVSVVATDLEMCMPLLTYNLERNVGCCGGVGRAMALPWGGDDLPSDFPTENVVVVCTDVVYDEAGYSPLLATITAMAARAPGCRFLMAHTHRNPADGVFFRALRERCVLWEEAALTAQHKLFDFRL